MSNVANLNNLIYLTVIFALYNLFPLSGQVIFPKINKQQQLQQKTKNRSLIYLQVPVFRRNILNLAYTPCEICILRFPSSPISPSSQ